MQEFWTDAKSWFFGLGEQYGVDPIIFGSIYVGAIPFFFLSVAWLLKAKKAGKPLGLPAISAGFWFISSYLYLFIAGENIPWWVYMTVIVLLAYAAYSSFRSIRAKLGKS
jgi:hypothetical protein